VVGGAALWSVGRLLEALSLAGFACRFAVADEQAATVDMASSRHATRHRALPWLTWIRPNVVASQRHGMVDG